MGSSDKRRSRAKRCRGVEPWPRLWHSLRASCESDLAQSFPLATVTKWLGNTPSVALRHYVDPTEAAFEMAKGWTPGGAKSGAVAAQKAAQQEYALSRTGSQSSPQAEEGEALLLDVANGCNGERTDKRECMGIEPTESFVQTLHRF